MMLDPTSEMLAQEIMRLSPRERDPRYFRTWQRVSLSLQRALRVWISGNYFRDLAQFDDRETAYHVLVYSAARLCYGRPKTEFTFDAADPRLVDSALHNIGTSLRLVLEQVSERLRRAGKIELSRRYSHVWRQDILRGVKKRPRSLIALFAAEAKLIDAIIDLGTSGDVGRYTRSSNSALRKILGLDLRPLCVRALEETVRVLREQSAGGGNHFADVRPDQDFNALGPRSPNSGIGLDENRGHRYSDGSREMRDSGIVADVDARGGKPAGQVVEVVVSDRVLDRILRSSDPADGEAQALGCGAKIFDRPVFSRAS